MAKQKQTVKLKEPVRIRFKQLSNGNQYIYLDYFTKLQRIINQRQIVRKGFKL